MYRESVHLSRISPYPTSVTGQLHTFRLEEWKCEIRRENRARNVPAKYLFALKTRAAVDRNSISRSTTANIYDYIVRDILIRLGTIQLICTKEALQ